MPAYKKPKYTIEQSQEIMMRAFGALCDSTEPMTIEEIQKMKKDIFGDKFLVEEE